MNERTHHNLSPRALGAGLLILSFAAGCQRNGGGGDEGFNLPDFNACGRCGELSEGAVGISGSVQIDGFFAAVAQLDGAVNSVRAQFDAEVLALARIWGLDVDADTVVDADLVDTLLTTIESEFTTTVSGGISLSVSPAQCSADLSIAASAQASCEASAGCDVQATPPTTSFVCEGQCEGICDQSCEGEIVCDASASGGIDCAGSCEGVCALEAPGTCEGTCRGSCTVDGETQDDFDGVCEGQCEGSCELAAGGSCEGTCHGSCAVESDQELACDAQVSCRGTCSGSCSGSCIGTATPPSATADCDASAQCQSSASAQASASLSCTPPSISLAYRLDPEIDANTRAAFEAQVQALRVHGSAIFQGSSTLRGLVTGDLDGDGNADIEPVVSSLSARFQVLVNAGVEGDLFADVAPGSLPCVVPAMLEAIDILGAVPGEASTTLEAQLEFTTGLIALGS